MSKLDTDYVLIRKKFWKMKKHLACALSYLSKWPSLEEMDICIGHLAILESLNMTLVTSGYWVWFWVKC